MTEQPASDLGPRVVSAIVLIIVAIGASLLGGLIFSLAMATLSVVIYYEWASITATGQHGFSVYVCAITLLAAFGFVFAGNPFSGFVLVVAVASILQIASALGILPGTTFKRTAWAVTGLLYALLAGLCLVLIRNARAIDETAGSGFIDYGFMLLVFLFLTVWATDIAAYFTGRHFGGAKLMPAVSPKKTWSGALGGLAGAFLVGILFGILVQHWSILWTIPSALVLSVLSQAGDLFESWVKRRFGVKDSSNLIPGHGGFMDRVDGLIFASVPLAGFAVYSQT